MAKSRRWTLDEVETLQAQLKGLESPEIKEKKAKVNPPPKKIICYKDYDYIIGIDTGVNTGFAIWSVKEKILVEVKTYKIHTVLDILRCNRYDNILVRVEDARLRTYIPRQKNEKAERGRAQGAGSVKRDAMIFEDFLKDNGFDYEMVAPKNNKTKMSAEHFQKVTGWVHKCSEHARDGAALCIGF